MKTTHKSESTAWRTLLIAIVLIALFVPSMPGSAQDPAKPDIHFTFDIKADGSNTAMLEIAVHPWFDSLIQKALKFFEEKMISGQGEEKRPRGDYEIITTIREGREYTTLAAHFNSLGDLSSFVNTPQMLSSLVGELAPGATIPALFSEFIVTGDEEDGRKTMKVFAKMDESMTRTLGFANVSVHVRLPNQLVTHNATDAKGAELTWVIEPSQPLVISATSAVPKKVNNTMTFSSSAPWLIGLLIIVALLLIISLVVILMNRSRNSRDDEGEEQWEEW